MSALSDPNSVDLTRDPTRDGDVRNERWWQELTGLPGPAADDTRSQGDEAEPPSRAG